MSSLQDRLASAVQAGQTEEITRLLQHGAEITTAVERAATIHGQIPVYRVLLRHGLPNLNNPLHAAGGHVVAAVTNDRHELLRYLLDNGADPDGGCRFEFMPAVAVAIEEGKGVDVLEVLREAGAKVGENGLLAMAVGEGRMDVVEWLLDCGADVDEDVQMSALVPHDKGTALHVVAETDRVDVLRLLLGRGASSGIRDSDGKLALDKAREAGQAEMVAVLSSLS
ncbi:hypothetical protein BLS_004261 [Venturia inaequalis]|uniref:Ankyrin n=1 Tax=Venturia inaequalis TaxID=5025 RepID=A0A8H3V987_VENIN|nr:hypothetical protein BLS_004261 [Venturia inaequalis]KAE9983741.1 hypothetical protein EG328_009541 [Venturia inaequalis]KAE9989543.1 hypothetical protein EG327_002585 [Venturia inaequalis]RDI87459.1 Tripeptidyl-peptidase sed2 [Venturia inaequalis]